MLLWAQLANGQQSMPKPTATPAAPESYELTSEEKKDLLLAQKDQLIAAYEQELLRQDFLRAQQKTMTMQQAMNEAAEKIRRARKWDKSVQFDAQTLTFKKPAADAVASASATPETARK
jgi:hypothetical protein